ncbi:Reticulocyte-binding protein 2-like protein a [Colletotrichum shisoi]|uniref:Reticulocyte-binding protein 2-like protein a n=1 Tax=Colletotrichum shisoi TaxID=2078593 RepID=A0A5Q4BSP9_9PEZI|nr:Reticulocyte-binding protein 2-like protein a [Colletotrichum shisoi]
MLSSTIDVGKGTSTGASGASFMMMQGVLRERDKLFTRPGEEEVRKKDGLVEEIVRSAAGGIGVISEALHHRKEKKGKTLHQSQEPSRTQLPSETAQSRPGEEAVPDSNNIVDQKATTGEEEESRSQKDQKDSGNLATAFINRRACLPGNRAANGRDLPLPVILPQRRPENRARGFLRAYAPLLADVGIDENTFLDFIDTFNKALEPSPWINALNLAGFAGSAMPEPASMLFGFGVEYATEAALEGHSRYSSNVFLDRVNSQFFNPRGLVCLVVTWQPDISNNQLNVNFEGEVSASRPNPGVSDRIGDIAAQRTSAKDGWQGMKGQMAEMMKMSNGNFSWPEPAPLVFPTAKDPLTESGSDDGAKKKKKKNALDRMEIWMEDMSDKRAQAKWADEHSDKPAASLMPNHEFRSRYADPNHPAASGDLVALVTGGRWTCVDKKKDKKSEKDSRSKEEDEENNGEGLKRVADSGKPGTDDAIKASDSVKKEEGSEEDERDERLKKEQREKRKEEEKRMKKEKKEKKKEEKERKEMEKKEKREREKNEKKAKKGNTDKKSKLETDNTKRQEDHDGENSKEDGDYRSFQRDDNSQVPTKEDKHDEGKEHEDKKAWDHDTDSDKLRREDDRKARDEKKARKEKEKADKIAKKKKAREEDWLSSLFRKDVLYLVVINLPSEQQVAAVTQAHGLRIP